MTTSPRDASAAIAEQQRSRLDSLPFSDTSDFDDANRGLVGRRELNAVTAEDGRVVWTTTPTPSSMATPRTP